MDQPLWQLEHVQLRAAARGDRPRLDDVSLSIQPGVTAVLGQSGAGKTSLLNLLVGFEQPDDGRVISRLAEAASSNGAAAPLFWSPQDAGLWPHLTLRQHLEAVVADAAKAASRIDTLLDEFDLTSRADARPHELSLGERSRLSVARALATQAAVLVMDEPLAHVDPARIGQFWSVIRRHVHEAGSSLVFATHSPQTVLAEAQRVVCLEAGRLLYEGEVQALYHDPPTPQAARCLGEVNWLATDDAKVWLDGAGESNQRGPCYRPEQIELVTDTGSPIVVQAHRFGGAVTEVELRDERSQRTRRFVCRSTARPLRNGDHVAVRAVVLLLACLLLNACNGGDAGPQLPISSVRTIRFPPEGVVQPAPRAGTIGDNGEHYVLDTAGRVVVLGDNGDVLRKWFMPDYQRGNPEGVCLLADGRLAIADTHYHRIVFTDQQGKVLGMLGQRGEGPGQFGYPDKVVQDDQQNFYVAEYGANPRVQKFAPDGTHLLSFGKMSADVDGFQRPSGLVWHDGRLYVSDAVNNRISVFDSEGNFIEVLGGSTEPPTLVSPYDLKLGPDERLYVAEFGAGRITVLSLDGQVIGRYGSPGKEQGQFLTPWGLTVDAQGRIWVMDTGNHRVVELTP